MAGHDFNVSNSNVSNSNSICIKCNLDYWICYYLIVNYDHYKDRKIEDVANEVYPCISDDEFIIKKALE